MIIARDSFRNAIMIAMANLNQTEATVTGYDCQFVTDPSDQLVCLICTYVARDPYQVDCCGKIYCKECLDELKLHSKTCPNCRKYGNSFFDRRADRDIKNLQVKCDNQENGCEWSGQLRQLDEHSADCGYELVDCPNNCLDDEEEEVFVMRKELDNHLCQCPNREFECPNCKEKGQYHIMTGVHLEECPQIEVPCPKRCKTTILRGEVKRHLNEICPNMAIPCKYAKIGCKESRLRKNLKVHEKNSTFHLKLALDTIMDLKEVKQAGHKVFKMTGFERYKRSHNQWSSPPFYSHSDGYKMQLTISVSNDTHMAAHVYLVSGRNDGNLVWPFKGEVTVTLLNQLEDRNHCSCRIDYLSSEYTGYNSIAVGKRTSALSRGTPKFLPLPIEGSSDCQYLKDDALYFRVSVRVFDSNKLSLKPWLTCTDS